MLTRTRRSRRAMPFAAATAALAAAVVAWLVPPALAQDQEPGPPLPPPTAESILANHLAVRADAAIREAGDAATAQSADASLVQAEVLLDQALAMQPSDPDLWRQRAAVATLLDDRPKQLRCVRNYVELRPEDDAAQLDLIVLKLDEMPVMEQRLEAVERLLNSPGGRSLSGPLKSRLATYAAAAAFELADERRHLRWLKRATVFDPANEAAARMAYEVTLRQNPETHVLGSALINWVRAAPLDPAPRLDLAELLVAEAAYREAARQYQVTFALTGGRLVQGLHYDRIVQALGGSGRTDEALALLSRLEDAISEGDAAATQPADGGPDDDRLVLPMRLELQRLTLLDDPARAEEAAASYARIRDRLLADAEAGDPDARIDLAWIAAVYGRDLAQVDRLLDGADPTDPRVTLARGWLALRQDKHDEAERLFDELRQANPMAATGLAKIVGEDMAGTARALQAVIRRAPLSLGALVAARELVAVRREVSPTPMGGAVVDRMARLPRELWRMDPTGDPWVSVSMTVVPLQFQYGERMPAVVTIKNISELPLAVGDGRALSSQAVVTLLAAPKGQPAEELPPVSLDAGRRLTLEPGEALTLVAELDRSALAGVIADHPFTPVTFKAMAVHDPRVLESGVMVPGPLGGTESVRGLEVVSTPLGVGAVAAWVSAIGDGDDAARQLRALAMLAAATGEGGAAATEAGRALGEAFGDLDETRRAWVVYHLTAADTATSPARRVFDQARRSDEPLVQVAYLARHVDSADSKELAAALRSRDREVVNFASALKRSLQPQASAAADAP